MPEYGTLADYSEIDVVGAIDELLKSGKLVRKGQRYPTVWMPGKPVRSQSGKRSTDDRRSDDRRSVGTGRGHSRRASPGRHGGSISRALDNYRKRTARSLGWKPYMVFQKKVMLTIDEEQPDSLEALEGISGLGAAKIDRFGEDILEIVRAHGRGE